MCEHWVRLSPLSEKSPEGIANQSLCTSLSGAGMSILIFPITCRTERIGSVVKALPLGSYKQGG